MCDSQFEINTFRHASYRILIGLPAPLDCHGIAITEMKDLAFVLNKYSDSICHNSIGFISTQKK